MRIVGRTRELSIISRAMAAPRERSMLVVGEPGSGKSRLLEAVHDEAPLVSTIVVANPAEAEWPLSGFSSVIGSINDARAIEFGGRFELRAMDPVSTFAAARDLLTLLRGLGLEPVQILIDDVDRMDVQSQALIGYMSGRLAGTRIRLVATATHVPPELAAMGRLPLDRLDQQESESLATALAGPLAEPGTMRILAAGSFGNPRALTDIVASLDTQHLSGHEPLALPFGGYELPAESAESLANLTGSQRRVVEMLAVAPLLPWSIVGASAGDDESARNDVNDLIDDGLLAEHGTFVRIVDPRMRSAVYFAMHARERQDRRRENLALDPDPDGPLARWHRSFTASDGVDPTSLLEAAQTLVLLDEPSAAVVVAERALHADEFDGRTAESGIAFATALYTRGEIALASRFLHLGRRPAFEPSTFLRWALLRIVVDFARTNVVSDDQVDVWVALARADEPFVATRILLAAAAQHAERWEFDAAAGLVESALGPRPRYDGIEDPSAPAVLSILDAHDGRQWELPSTESLAESAPPVVVEYGFAASMDERYADARRIFTALVEKRSLIDPVWRELAYFHSANNELRRADFRRARSMIDEWEGALLPSQHLVSGRMYLRYWRARADSHDDADELFAEATARATVERDTAVTARLLTTEGRRFIAANDPAEASRLLTSADLVARGFDHPGLVRHLADLVEALMGEERTVEAQEVLLRFREAEARHPSRWGRLALARAEALAIPDETSLVAFRDAVAIVEPADPAYELGRTLLAQARRLERFGRREASETAFTAAHTAFVEAGAALGSEAIEHRAAPNRETDREAILAMLTPEERDVAERVRLGFRNKEIAEALFVSLRTVELRLTRIYRKVGARSRSHLVGLLR